MTQTTWNTRKLETWVRFALVGGASFALTAALACGSRETVERSETRAVAVAPAKEEPQAPVSLLASRDAGTSGAAEVAAPVVPRVEPLPVRVTVPHEDRETDFVAKAQAEMDRGELALAFDSLRKHLFVKPPTVEVLLNLGRIGRQIGQNEVAEQALLDAVALDAQSSEAELELARSYLDAGRLAEARAHARRAIRLDGENPAPWIVAGRVALKEGEFARAELAFRRAVALDPMNAMAYNNLGLLYIHMKRASDAVDALEASVELFGEETPSFVLNNLGLALEMGEHYEEAREAFEAALVEDSGYVRAAVNLKRVLTTLQSLEDDAAFRTARGVEAEDEVPSL